jgi:hypothetical protein
MQHMIRPADRRVGERVTTRTLLGAVLILVSVALVNIRWKRELPPETLSGETISP